MNDSPVKKFTATYYREMSKDIKKMPQWENRVYEVEKGKKAGSYYVSGRDPKHPRKLPDNPDNGMGPYDDILPP